MNSIPETWICAAGSIALLLLNMIWVLIVWIRDKPNRQGYQTIDVEIQPRKVTFLEGSIYFLTLVQWSTVLMCLVLAMVAQQSWMEWLYHGALLLGWGFQYLLVHFETTPNSTAPRYHFIQYAVHLSVQSYYVQVQEPDLDSLFSILNNLSLCVPLILFILEVVNPTKGGFPAESDDRAPSLQQNASLWSLITYTWVNPLLVLGSSRLLEQEDIPHLLHKDRMQNVIKEWNKYHVDGNSVVSDSIWFTKWYAIYQLSLSILTTTLDFSKPFFINLLLNWIQRRKDGDDNMYGYYLLGGMFISSLLKQILESQINLSSRHWAIQLRSIYIYEIFNKSLHRTGGASLEDEEGKASQGKIVSLMSNDTNQIRWFLTMIHGVLIDIPLSLVISISGLLYIMGPPALAGLAVMLISGPISTWATTRLYKILKVTRTMVDRRIQVTNEALQGIRIIKYMAWEPQFIKKICDAREDELRSRLRLFLSNALVNSLAWAASILVTFTSFFFYTIVAGKQLDAATAFTSISLLETLSYTLSSVSETVSEFFNVRVTMSRINTFLQEDELEKYKNGNPANLNKDCKVAINHGTFGYHGSQSTGQITEETPLLSEGVHSFKLQDISIRFPKNQLSVIIGATGSGKTSILLTLLGGKCLLTRNE
jgi:ABC-type multidrug transport system fused ATPase/permease subunit